MEHDITLNIHWSVPEEVWIEIGKVYRSMPYWSGEGKWIGIEVDLWVSVELGGFQIAGRMPESIWYEWYDSLKNKLTKSLGYQIGEPCDGFDFKYWE